MKQHQFEATHQPIWQRYEYLLGASGTKKRAGSAGFAKKKQQAMASPRSGSNPNFKLDAKSDDNIDEKPDAFESAMQGQGYEFIHLYRVTCQHYALAKQRHYSPQLVTYLQDLVTQGHEQLYQHQSHIGSKIYQFFRYTFPIRLRRHAGLFWLSLAFFLLPALLMGWSCYEQADMIYSVLPVDQVRAMQEMYNPANEMVGRDSSRRSDTDLMMFGHYISNNIGIDFRVYALGIFAGIGTLLGMLYNGVVIGGIGGHLSGIGYGETFWPFVSGHGSFELVAAVISGAAGLRLAQSLFMPGNYSRLDAFKIAGKQSIELLIGAASMTFIAAFIEAFWSSSALIPDIVKYLVAVVLWALVIGYLLFAGRQYERRHILLKPAPVNAGLGAMLLPKMLPKKSQQIVAQRPMSQQTLSQQTLSQQLSQQPSLAKQGSDAQGSKSLQSRGQL